MALFAPRVGHEALFEEVCRLHEIDRKTKAMLQTIIKKYQMPHPASIFVEPSTMRRALSDPELSANSDLQDLYNAWFIEQAKARR